MIVTPHERRTEYVGTREELIEQGHAHANMFPEPPKRVRREWGPEGWDLRRIKGGHFRLTRYREPIKRPTREKWDPEEFLLSNSLIADSYFRVLCNSLAGKSGLERVAVHRIDDKSMRKIRGLFFKVMETMQTADILPVEGEVSNVVPFTTVQGGRQA